MTSGTSPNWLIDGMNVIGSRPDGWWRDRQGAIRRLSARLALFAAASSGEIRVVFDGPLPASPPEPEDVEVMFAPGGPNAADRRMVSFLRSTARPETWKVVTSDGQLARDCESLGAQVMGAGDFRAMLEREVPLET